MSGRKTILLVEAIVPLRAVLRRTLERAGYRVMVAGGLGDVTRITSRTAGPIHLMLADLAPPFTSAPVQYRYCLFLHPRMKVLYMGEECEGIHSCGTPFLRKPFALGDFMEKVRAELEGS